MKVISNFWKAEDGQDLVEYSLLLALIAVAAIALLSGVKADVNGIWTQINSSVRSANSASS